MNRKIKNDDTLGFYLIKHMKGIAESMTMDRFSCWFVEKIIIPYSRDEKAVEWVCNSLGFRKSTTIDKIYYRLKETTFN